MKKQSVLRGYWGWAILLVVLAFTLSSCGHSSSKSSSCSSGRVKCGSVCCSTGQTCVDGACEFPYNSAILYIYFCPNFYTEGCSSGSMLINGTCYSFTAAPATCNSTGYTVYGSTAYSFQNCPSSNCTSCSAPFNFTTPEGFAEPYYYAGSWRCNTDCNAPSECP